MPMMTSEYAGATGRSAIARTWMSAPRPLLTGPHVTPPVVERKTPSPLVMAYHVSGLCGWERFRMFVPDGRPSVTGAHEGPLSRLRYAPADVAARM